MEKRKEKEKVIGKNPRKGGFSFTYLLTAFRSPLLEGGCGPVGPCVYTGSMTAPHYQAGPDVVRSGQLATARVLRARWSVARKTLDTNDTDRNYAEEQKRWDELIDYIEANDLNETEVDPR